MKSYIHTVTIKITKPNLFISPNNKNSCHLSGKRKVKTRHQMYVSSPNEQVFPQVGKGLCIPQIQSVKEIDVRWEIPPCAKSYKQKG